MKIKIKVNWNFISRFQITMLLICAYMAATIESKLVRGILFGGAVALANMCIGALILAFENRIAAMEKFIVMDFIKFKDDYIEKHYSEGEKANE